MRWISKRSFLCSRATKTALGSIMGIFLALTGAASHAAAPRWDTASIRKIHFLLASDQGLGRSSFGHAYLRLSRGDQPALDDEVVEFVASEPVDGLVGYARALGLGPSMERAVVVAPYSRVLNEMNFISLRDLTSHELALTPAQRERIVTILNGIVAEGRYGDYQFFTDNCASAVTSIFKEAGVSIPGDIRALVPDRIPALLRDAGLIAATVTDYNLQSRREHLHARFAPALGPDLPEISGLRPLLLSLDQGRRLLGLEKLLQAARVAGLRTDSLRQYLNGFKFLEPVIVRDLISRMIRGETYLEQPSLPQFRIELPIADPGFGYQVTAAAPAVIPSRDGGFELQIDFQYRPEIALPGGQSGTVQVRLPVPGLRRADDSADILYAGHKVGVLGLRSIHGQEVALFGLIFIPQVHRVNPTTWEGEVSVVLDPDTEVRTAEAGAPGAGSLMPPPAAILPLRNTDPARPSCNAFVELEQALLTRALFAPELPPIPETASLDLVRRTLQGALIVVPGFADASSWLSSLNESRLRDVIFQYNQSNYGTLKGALETWLRSDGLSTGDLLTIGRLARTGQPTPVYMRVRGNEAHALLILDVIDEGDDGLRLIAYDPNLGLVRDAFRFRREDSKIHSPFYPSAPLRSAGFDLGSQMVRHAVLFPALRPLLIRLVRTSGVYWADPSLLAQIY